MLQLNQQAQRGEINKERKEAKTSSPAYPQLCTDINYYLQDAKLLHSPFCTCKSLLNLMLLPNPIHSWYARHHRLHYE